MNVLSEKEISDLLLTKYVLWLIAIRFSEYLFLGDLASSLANLFFDAYFHLQTLQKCDYKSVIFLKSRISFRSSEFIAFVRMCKLIVFYW